MKQLRTARTPALAVALGTALLLVAAASAATTSQSRNGKATGARVGLEKTALGTVLVDARGRTLYTFVGDKRSGRTAGEGLDVFGAEWYVVAANGHNVEQDEGCCGKP